MVQKMQTLMLDAVDSRKNDETLTDNFQKIEKEFQALKQENQKFREEFQKVLETLNEGIRQLQSTQADKISELSFLKNNYLNFSFAVSETLKSIQNDQTAQEIQLKKMQSAVIQEIPGNYAFYAQLTSPASDNYVVFDNVTTNEGSAYDGSTGIFTCKYSGSYVFSWTIATSSHRYTEAELLVNEGVIGSSGTDSRPSKDTADSSTGFVVYNLQLRDNVQIRVNGTADGIYSTFSGWRLSDSNSYFHAKAMSTLNKPFSNSQGFLFKSVINNGDEYDSNKGIFTCPENGLYAFAFAVEASDNTDFDVYLYRSGSQLSSIEVYPDASPGEYVDTSSTLQIFQLSKGDSIYAYPSQSDSAIEPFHSTFSGWQIEHPTSTTPAFLAYTSSDTSSKPLYYNTELLDTSNSFSSTYFQAPKDGVYLFFWNIEAWKKRLESSLQVNDETVGRTIGDGRTSESDSSSNLAILRLHKNDNVTVMHDGAADGYETIISGYFLFP